MEFFMAIHRKLEVANARTMAEYSKEMITEDVYDRRVKPSYAVGSCIAGADPVYCPITEYDVDPLFVLYPPEIDIVDAEDTIRRIQHEIMDAIMTKLSAMGVHCYGFGRRAPETIVRFLPFDIDAVKRVVRECAELRGQIVDIDRAKL